MDIQESVDTFDSLADDGRLRGCCPKEDIVVRMENECPELVDLISGSDNIVGDVEINAVDAIVSQLNGWVDGGGEMSTLDRPVLDTHNCGHCHGIRRIRGKYD